MIEQASEYIKQLSENKYGQDKLDTWLGFILEKDNSYEKLREEYKQSIDETRESLLKEYFDYKGIDYNKIELQMKNMKNFKLKDGLFYKISYANEKGADYYFKGEFIMKEDYGVFYLGEWYE